MDSSSHAVTSQVAWDSKNLSLLYHCSCCRPSSRIMIHCQFSYHMELSQCLTRNCFELVTPLPLPTLGLPKTNRNTYKRPPHQHPTTSLFLRLICSEEKEPAPTSKPGELEIPPSTESKTRSHTITARLLHLRSA